MHVFCYLIISFENMKKKKHKRHVYIGLSYYSKKNKKKNACIYYIFWMDNKKSMKFIVSDFLSLVILERRASQLMS